MKTAIVDAQVDVPNSVAMAVAVLESKNLVGIPTETVYGLAGDALELEVLAKIFEVKERPYFDPLIIHLGSKEWLDQLTLSSGQCRSLVETLVQRFWPGPLTILFSKSALVPDLATGGLEHVALRMPSHPVFLEVLRAFGKPLAAPSANRFGRVSPTRAEHVMEELDGRIPLILDAGSTALGLESTIVRVDANGIGILRPGPVTEEILAEIAPTEELAASQKITVPGQSVSHYAPDKLVYLFDPQAVTPQPQDAALICWGPPHHTANFSVVRSISETKDLRVAAQRLFGLLREMDQLNVKKIFVDPVPEEGLGKAIMNRVRRAAAPRGRF
jgi:L-threonylcarbamoyladenylate synthase